LNALYTEGVVVALVMAVIGALLALLISQSVTRPLHQLMDATTRIAEGDLTQKLTAHQGMELLVLADAFNRMNDQLGATVRRMRTTGTLISNYSGEIAVAAAHQSEAAQRQAAAITQVTGTMEELNQTAEQIATVATDVAGAAEQALDSAGQGQNAVRQSIEGIEQIKTQMNEIAARNLALAEQSRHISNILKVIDGIADQTNLLALNAAIESATAGPQGRRFAVIAQEVKLLAENSMAATTEVHEIISQIQAASTAAVVATEAGLQAIEQGVQLAHQSGHANDTIIAMVGQTVQLAQAIRLITQQQRTASEQVVTTMRETVEATRQTATMSQQTLDVVTHLSEMARQLEVVTEHFRLAPPGASGPPAPPPAGSILAPNGVVAPST
jgi:methyl-accepting chemotaxis protein